MFSFATSRPHRKPSLTPMIDVVFLLLVFFMLAARFGQDGVLPLSTAGVGALYQGPPRLVEVEAGGVLLNGVTLPLGSLATRLGPLMETPQDTVILRPRAGAELQELVQVLDHLRAAGLMQVVIVEGRQ